MKNTNIAGLTEEWNPNLLSTFMGQTARRTVWLNGEECQPLSRKEILCEEKTSYYGCVLDSWERYRASNGKVFERHYMARGGGLERTVVHWSEIVEDAWEYEQEKADKETEDRWRQARAETQEVIDKM